MSNSVLVCARDGLPVHGVGRNGYRHSLGGRIGAIPERRRHKPVPVLRTEYDRAFGLNTPREEALELVGRFRALDQQINGERAGRDEKEREAAWNATARQRASPTCAGGPSCAQPQATSATPSQSATSETCQALP